MDRCSPKEEHVLQVMSSEHIRVAVVGNVDSGKSTLIGTLASATLDDGNGSNRAKVTKYKHELSTGQTSSVSCHTIGFDKAGCLVKTKKIDDESDIVLKSHRVVTLMDLAGHEKYFKTTVAGLSKGMVDYSLLLINSAQPPTHMTMKHLQLCSACGIPVIAVMTKGDMCPAQVFEHARNKTMEMLLMPDVGKRPYAIQKQSDIGTVKGLLHTLAPIVNISCVTGEGINLLRGLLFHLPKRRQHQKKRVNSQAEFLVEDIMVVKGVGVVLSGFVNVGEFQQGDVLYIGPLKGGECLKTKIRSIHVAQTHVGHVWAGHSACFAVILTKPQRRMLRRGVVALKEPPNLYQSFTANVIFPKGDAVTVTTGRYQAIAHILHQKEAVRVTKIKSGGETGAPDLILRPGGKAVVTLEFVRGKHYVRRNMRVILRDGNVRAIGVVADTGG